MKNYPHGPPMPLCLAWACIFGHRNPPPCPGWGGLPPAPPFLLEERYPNAPSLLCLPFLAFPKSHFSNEPQRTKPGRGILPVIPLTFSSLPALCSTRPHGDLRASSCGFCLKTIKPCPLWTRYGSAGLESLPCRGRTAVHWHPRAPGHFWPLMAVTTIYFTQFPFSKRLEIPAVGLGLAGTQIQVLQCLFSGRPGKPADFPAVLIRASAPSPRRVMQQGQPSTNPLGPAIANGRTCLNNANKGRRGVASGCWTDYHCFERFTSWFLRTSSLCKPGCWLSRNQGAVRLWVFPVLEAGTFLAATTQL